MYSLQDSEGMLDFLAGERFKFISVTIVDNPVPELDKIFRVELYNPEGGGRVTNTILFLPQRFSTSNPGATSSH